MASSRIAVVFYSRTGTTKQLALEVAKALDADAVELTEERSRRGLFGYLRSGFEASRGKTTTLRDAHEEVLGYDLVIVATPVWVSAVCSPVRTFLRRHAGKLPPLAFLATMGGRGSETAFQQMAAEARRAPVATLALTTGEVRAGKQIEKVSAFIRDVRKAAPARAASNG
jgi:flavodoxin